MAPFLPAEDRRPPREAIEPGSPDFLMKPVPKDLLAQALRHVADSIEMGDVLEREEPERRKREEPLQAFVEAAFLHGVMLGERFGEELARYRDLLGISEPFALVAAAAFLPPHGSTRPDEEMRILHERFRATVRTRTRAFAGPLVAGHALILLPVPDAASAIASQESLHSVLVQVHGGEFEKDLLRIGFGGVKPLADVASSWSEAVGDLLGNQGTSPGGDAKPHPFEHEDAFLEDLQHGSPERARSCLENLVEPLRNLPALPVSERYRIIVLFGSACRILAKRGLMDHKDASAMMNLEDLRAAGNGPVFEQAVRARFDKLVDFAGRGARWSPLVSRAIGFVRENYGKPINLESTAYALGVSPSRLSRLFSEETGQGFSAYLIELRIEKAKDLLAVPGTIVKEVSVSCGYSDPNYFSRLFKKVTGMTPSAFVRQAESGNA